MNNKGLTVSVFRNADHNGDSTNGGTTSKQTNILLIDGQMRGLYEPEKGEVYLTLVRRNLKQDEPAYIHAVPTVDGIQKTGGMFGGNFIYCSDARVRELNAYPIPVHDRFEN